MSDSSPEFLELQRQFALRREQGDVISGLTFGLENETRAAAVLDPRNRALYGYKVDGKNVEELVGSDLRGHLIEVPVGAEAARRSGEHPEMHASMTELVSGITEAENFRRVIVGQQVDGIRASAPVGAWPIDCSVPVSGREPIYVSDQRFVPGVTRYELFGREYALFRGMSTAGQHFHVGVDDPDTAIKVRRRLADWEPVAMALTGSSPIVHGRYRQCSSARIAYFDTLKSAVDLPWVDDRTSYDVLMNTLANDVLKVHEGDRTRIHPWTRPAELWPTVELRWFDNGLTLDDRLFAAYLSAGLTNGLLHEIETLGPKRTSVSETDLDAIYGSRSRRDHAVRHGMNDTLYNPMGGDLAPAWDVAEEMFSIVRSGLTRIEAATGLAEGQLVDEFNLLASDLRLHGTGEQRIMRQAEAIINDELRAGLDVTTIEQMYEGKPLSSSTLDRLQVWILDQNLNGELIPGGAKLNQKIVGELSRVDQEKRTEQRAAGERSDAGALRVMSRVRREVAMLDQRFQLDLLENVTTASNVRSLPVRERGIAPLQSAQ